MHRKPTMEGGTVSVQLDESLAADKRPMAEDHPEFEFDDWDLDVTIVEGGLAADQLIRMTDDGCNSTCQTACNSCP
jgi:FxLD family lantipeptide